MGLEDIVSGTFRKVKNFFFTPKKKEKMMDYLVNDSLQKYFKGASQEEKKQLYDILSKQLDSSREKYSKYLNSWQQKSGNIGAITTSLSDAYQMFGAKIPLTGAQYTPLAQLMYGLSAIPEGYKMAKYTFKSGDYLSGLKWLGLKTLGLALPIVGPMLGYNAMDKLIRKRTMQEAKDKFLKEIGRYDSKTLRQKLDDYAAKITGKKIKPIYNGSFAPGYA